MAFELPNEIWMGILKRLTTVKDLGRIQQVSRAFNTIIRDECWVRIKELILDYRTDKDQHGKTLYNLYVDKRHFWPWLSEDKLLLLVDELEKKATKIQSVSLDRDDELFYGVLQRLTSASLKIQDLTLLQDCFSAGSVAALADFVRSISGTLKNLQLEVPCWLCQPDFGPDLHQAFRQCTALENVKLDMNTDSCDEWFGPCWFYDRLFESVLFGASQLKALTICLPEFYYISTIDLLNYSGAHLSKCELQWDHLEDYVRCVHQGEWNVSSSDHPLKSLKTLTLSGDLNHYLMILPMELFPDLQEVTVHQMRITPEDVNDLICGFLSEYKDGSGEPRLLSLQTSKARGLSSLEEVSGAMDWPVSWAEETEVSMEFKFVRGDATAKLFIHCRRGFYTDYSD